MFFSEDSKEIVICCSDEVFTLSVEAVLTYCTTRFQDGGSVGSKSETPAPPSSDAGTTANNAAEFTFSLSCVSPHEMTLTESATTDGGGVHAAYREEWGSPMWQQDAKFADLLPLWELDPVRRWTDLDSYTRRWWVPFIHKKAQHAQGDANVATGGKGDGECRILDLASQHEFSVQLSPNDPKELILRHNFECKAEDRSASPR